MLKWAVKQIFFLAIATIVVLPITALVVDDDTVSEMLQDIPGGTGQTGAIIMHKRLLASTIINYVDDALISLELIILETTDDALSSLKLTFLELFGTFLPDGSQKKVVVTNTVKTKVQKDCCRTQKKSGKKKYPDCLRKRGSQTRLKILQC
jgi:hypothetical protein